jgi:GNAT superfamily N-acetyltransferase
LPDDLLPLTELLHRAYAELAARGLKFVATHQPPEMTEKRVRAGNCFIAEANGVILGTITVQRSKPDARLATYREPTTFIFGQFGVDPTMRGKGIGRALHDRALRFAAANGGTAMALDTAAPARHLIALYFRWGYREVGRHSWESTNYESVIMKKELSAANPAEEAATHTAPDRLPPS